MYTAGDLEIIRTLLNHGADISGTGRKRGYFFEGPLGQQSAKPQKNKDGGYGANDGVFPLFVATSFLNVEAVQELIKQGADLNQTTAIGQSAMHAACINKDGSQQLALFSNFGSKSRHYTRAQEILMALLDGGANINQTDDFGRTPLHYACINANIFFIHSLIERGAKVNVKDKQGLSILETAALKSGDILEEIVKCCNPGPEICDAYEICCLADDHYSCGSLLKGMKKATVMRTENNFIKKIVDANESFRNIAEWTNLDDIAQLENDSDLQELLEQCLLARERIFQGRYMPFDGGKIALGLY